MTFIKILLLLTSLHTWAAPIINENASTNYKITVYQDHLNPHLYYVAPTSFVIAGLKEANPAFSYTEYWLGRRKQRAVIQTILAPEFADAEIKITQDEILKKNPKAIFTSIPFLHSQVKFGTILNDFILKSDCDHLAGTIESEQACSFLLYGKGVNIFKQSIIKRLTLTLAFEYQFQGVMRMPDGSFKSRELLHQVVGKIGSNQLVDFPALFTNEFGQSIF